MEASRIFNEIISKIENSHLNYMITKTPFSANVSIKCSFIKYQCVKEEQSESEAYNEQEEKPNSEIVKLCADLERLNAEKVYSEDLLNQERMKVKSLESELREAKDEILKTKKEKKSFSVSLHACKADLDKRKDEMMESKKITENLRSQLKSQNVELKDANILSADLKKRNIELENQLDKSTKELESTKKEKTVIKDSKNECQCPHCDVICESTVQLGQHVRSYHFKNQVSQTKKKISDREIDFLEYSCFYCNKTIESPLDLEEHKPVCLNVFESPISPPSIYLQQWDEWPCDMSETNLGKRLNLERHKTPSHQQEIKPYNHYYNEEDLKCCDFCGREFGSLGSLRNHIRSLHKEMLPT